MVAKFHHGYGQCGVNVMVDEETREFVFLIGNDVEGFGVCGSHWQFLWVCDYFVFDNDRGG